MRWLTTTRRRVTSLFRRHQLDLDLDEELRYHLDRQVEVNLAKGMSSADARFAALREFGGLDQRIEECREARGVAFVESLWQDARYAFRALRKAPGFTAVAVLSLALGIGANTTIFSFVNAVLLRPLPYPDSARLVVLRERPPDSDDTVAVHPLNFLEWRSRTRSFEALALVQSVPANVLGRDGAEQITDVQTTPELFRAFGVSPALGRDFTAEDARPGAGGVAILGYAFWQSRFGGDPTVVGRALAVSDGSFTIVGVAAEGLRIGTTEPDVFTPLAIDPAKPDSIGTRSFSCYGRLKRGVSLEAARAEMTVVASGLARQYPLDEGYGVFVSTLHDYLVKDGRPALRLLMAVVAAVLVIACVNLAGLLMARGMARGGELALRASLGASRGRLARQVVIESLVLASLGGAAGLAAAYWSTHPLVVLTEGALTTGGAGPIGLDSTCLVFTLLLSTITALLFGLVPAWHASRAEPQAALGERSRGGTADRRHHRIRSALVVAEVALAVVLLVGAGLLLRTFSRLTRVDLGFQPAETVTMRLFLGDRDPVYRVATVDRILEQVEALPGVKAASTIQFLPLTGMSCGTGFWFEGQTPGDPSRARPTACSLISRGYFAAMGIPVLQGRGFDVRDRLDSPRVVIVNQAFARQYFAGKPVLGRRIAVAGPNQALAEIIAVVGDIRHDGLMSEPSPTVFLLHAQTPGYITNLVVRAAGDPAAQATAIRHAIQGVDRSQAVSAVKTMDQYVEASLARPRLYAALVTSFAVLAVILAAMGVYGLIAYVVALRTHEIGIRLALGAGRTEVFRRVLLQGLRLAFVGLAVGIGGALAMRRLVSALLFGVTDTDPVTYLAAFSVFALVVLASVAVPATRAARLNPMTALRYE